MEANTQKMLVNHLRQAVPGLLAVYLFGSAARGESRPDSDVDIAILSESALDGVRRFTLASELASYLGRNVDLVDLRAATTIMQAQVMDSGERLWAAPSASLDEFEAHILSDYARLNEERAAILDDIHQRGSIHAG